MYYFASDVHLGAGDELSRRRTEQCFVRWLDMVSADAEVIFLVGDIFDGLNTIASCPKALYAHLANLPNLPTEAYRLFL